MEVKTYTTIFDRAKAAYGTGAYDDATLEFLFPELAESEYEKVRKDIVAAVEMYKDFSQRRKEEIYAWLENQKPSFSHDVAIWDRGLNTGIEIEKKQKEQKDYHKLYEDIAQSEWFKKAYVGKSLGEEQPTNSEIPKESKPAELTPLTTLLSNYLKNDFEYFATKKWDEKKWNEILNIQASELLRYAKKELEKEQKTTWSEEDENMRNNIISVLSLFVGTVACDSNPSLSSSYLTYPREIAWLKSLRPSWKPSEEQMEALQRAVNKLAKTDVADSVRLSIVYDNLKKRM